MLMRWAQPLLRRKFARRAQLEPLYGQFVEERFGRYTQASHGHWIWIHAVSLGETRTAGILLKGLREALPGMRLLLTHGTATGREEGAKLLLEGDVQIWQPWDSKEAVSQFLDSFKPQIGLLMETEVWPNMVKMAQLKNIPLVLVNARMSKKSMRNALRWPALMRPAYAGLRSALAQTQDDANRLKQLGVQVDGVLGNLKFDAKPDAEQVSRGHRWRDRLTEPVLMLASSREGEEALWLNAWAAYLNQHPTVQMQWLLVPRHPQRVNEVEALIQAQGWFVSRRSQWTAEGPLSSSAQGEKAPSIWLGDSMGEMALYYSLSQVALLGGSFAPLGGQNLIEGIACGCQVIMGPHTFNFTEAAHAAETEGVACRATSMTEAIHQAVSRLQNSQMLGLSAGQALTFVNQHAGATHRTVVAVQGYLNRSGV